jgi:hypothetical protein
VIVRGAHGRDRRARTGASAVPVGVAGDAGAEEVGEPLGEVDAAAGAERLAGAEPHQGAGREAIAHGGERGVVAVRRRERGGVERLAVDQRRAPPAVAPVLELGDRLGARRQPRQRVGPRAHADRGVDAAEPAVQRGAGAPRRRQPAAADDAGAIVDEDAHASSVWGVGAASKRRRRGTNRG